MRTKSAFSLLEVMVAMAILTVGLVSLLQVQARSAQLAIEGRELTVATMLARSKLYDCQHDLLKKGFSVGDYDEDGNFDDDGYPKIYWECHGYKPEMPTGDGVGDMGSAASALGGSAGGNAAADNGAADMSMQMLAPVLQQMASVMGDSIRELVVIVHWGEGDERRDITVTTHVIDKTPVNGVAQMIQRQAGALTGALGGGARDGAGGGGSSKGPGSPPTPPGIPGMDTIPGMRSVPVTGGLK
jgi:general secretion pathway protein I